MNEGDVLILVRKRGPLFHEIISACKGQGLAIAGADRLRLGGEMAVRDLTALLAFLATPEDDLSLGGLPALATVRLVRRRAVSAGPGPRQGRIPVVAAARAGRQPDAGRAARSARQTDFLRPYDLVERMLSRHDGRRRLIARLGTEAEDGIDAFLAQALSYEQAEIPSLTGFLSWLERDEVELKRELDSASPDAAGHDRAWRKRAGIAHRDPARHGRFKGPDDKARGGCVAGRARGKQMPG